MWRREHACITLIAMPQSQLTRNNHPMLFQCWANIKRALGECQVFVGVLRKLYSRSSVGVVLGQRRRRLTGNKPAMGYDAGPTLNMNWVGMPTSCVQGTS